MTAAITHSHDPVKTTGAFSGLAVINRYEVSGVAVNIRYTVFGDALFSGYNDRVTL